MFNRKKTQKIATVIIVMLVLTMVATSVLPLVM